MCHEQQLNPCQGTLWMCELQHVAQLLPAINQPLGASSPCWMLFALLLWDAGLPTGWRAAASREHPASSCWEPGCLPVWQFFWLWSGGNQGEKRKEKKPSKTKHKYFRGKKCREMSKMKIQAALIITVVIYLFIYLLVLLTRALIRHNSRLSTRHWQGLLVGGCGLGGESWSAPTPHDKPGEGTCWGASEPLFGETLQERTHGVYVIICFQYWQVSCKAFFFLCGGKKDFLPIFYAFVHLSY